MEKKKVKFTQNTLKHIMDEIVEEYFSDDAIENGCGLMDVIESVIAGYSEEISTLPN